MTKLLTAFVLALVCLDIAFAQTAVVTRNVNLRPTASTDGAPIAKLTPGTQVRLVESNPIGRYYHVETTDGRTGFVWGGNLQVQVPENGSPTPAHPPIGTTAPTSPLSGQGPMPLLAKGHSVDWWFVFKFNSSAFPGCGGTAVRACLFGGDVQNYKAFSQQFVYASSEAQALQQGNDCLGDTIDDPIGATFDE